MKLLYAPGACSLGIHVLLEEIGKPYEAQAVNFPQKEQYGSAFTAINPKSKVPTLVRDDGSVLTEFPAIAYWLARSNSEKKLLPDDVDAQARALEAMDYVVATVHMQGFSRIVRPENYAPSAGDHDAVKARGREIFEKGLALIDKQLAGKEYVAGPFSIADAALFYAEFWGAARLKMELPPNCRAHYQRMLARPAVQRAMQAEGLQGLMRACARSVLVSASWRDRLERAQPVAGQCGCAAQSDRAGAGSIGGGVAAGAGDQDDRVLAARAGAGDGGDRGRGAGVAGADRGGAAGGGVRRAGGPADDRLVHALDRRGVDAGGGGDLRGVA